MNETLTLEFDGGSRGNPGPAGIGVVVRAEDGTAIVTLGRFIGRATNNVAEYRALITAMQEAQKLGATAVKITGDSELIIKQMTGVYRVKSPDMRVLFDEAQQVIRQFKSAKFHHNLRHKNELADKLANLAMDRKADVTNADHVGDKIGGGSGGGGKPLPIDEPSPEAAKAGDVWSCMRCGAIMETKRPSSLRPHQLKPPNCQCGQAMVSATTPR
ncbi:MAG TPA: ribonuclease HI family protein [Tepidisphaeraceae bacterium]|jgi:ribonuclease HI|nr:ribonuclease HI family protein [Tepidisphaeraceae bacterium]